jgi:hypothetical protein
VAALEQIPPTMRQDFMKLLFEPGFGLLAALLSSTLGSPELGVRSVSALFFLIMAYYLRKANRDETFVLLAFYAPAYFYAYSMNALRIGIASAIFLIASQMLMRGSRMKSYIWIGLSFTFHYTISFVVFYLVVNLLKVTKWWKILSLVIIGSLIFIFIQGRIFQKLDLYTESERPSALSGLSNLVAIALLAIGVLLSSLSLRFRLSIFILAISITSIMYFDSIIGYAGLRFLNLISFSIPILVLISHQLEEKLLNLKMKTFILLSGLSALAATYRGWMQSYGVGKSPFLPYEFFSNMNI